jgi:hypothetical protein
MPLSTAHATRARIRVLLLAGAAVEAALFIWLAAGDEEAFRTFVSTPDTSTYLGVAQLLAEEHTLGATPRTLGYPLFAAAIYFVAGKFYGPYALVALQLLLNLGLTWLGWRLLERMAPEISLRMRTAATLFLFWAGLGMAAFLMTDLLAALCFTAFLYGFLFWRDWRGAVVAAAALGVATLTRPTFTFFPLLLPLAAYLVRHVTSRIPAAHIVLFASFSIAATSVSLVYQYRFNQYIGPSPILNVPIQEMLYLGVVRPQSPATDYSTFQQQFAAEIERRAGRPFSTIALADKERYAKEVFRDALRKHPGRITAVLVTNAGKYVFAPIESIVARMSTEVISFEAYGRYVRPVIFAMCLPILVLALMPPLGQQPGRRMYYSLVMVFLVYIVGFSAIGAGSGERIRFPMLAFMLPVALWNARRIGEGLHSRLGVSLANRPAQCPTTSQAGK